MPPKGHRHVGGVFKKTNKALFGGSSGSSTHSGASHLDGDNDHFLRRNEFETFEGEFAALDGLTETEVSHVDRELFGDGVNRGAHFETAYHVTSLPPARTPSARPTGAMGTAITIGLVGVTS